MRRIMNPCHEIWMKWRKFMGVMLLGTTVLVLLHNTSPAPITITLQNPVAFRPVPFETEKPQEQVVITKSRQAPTIANDAKIFNYRGCPIRTAVTVGDFYDYLKKKVTPCRDLKQIGGHRVTAKKVMDGDKYVCFDDDYKWKFGNCHVLSFGISNDWTFDDIMDQKYGCKVYAFDPTMNAKEHNRSKNIHFYPIGLSDIKGRVMIKKINSPVDTYENLIKMLKLEDTSIDYLKMDIEGSEMNFFDDVLIHKPELFSNINQFGLEIHQGFPKKGVSWVSESSYFNKMYLHMQRLECLGYQLLAVHKNLAAWGSYSYKGENQPCCFELVYGKKPT